MADGSRSPQHGFHFPQVVARSRLRPGEIVVDLFAGGGGASHALESALARAVDIAINHNPWAIGMHAANHPFTRHLCEDVYAADPRAEVGGRLVGVLHGSPDCTHFSQAKGGQPRSTVIRGLSWVLVKWAGSLRRSGNAPRIITLENVEQILKWGPLVAKRCRGTGRVIRLDGTVAAPGERVPRHEQFLVPDKRHAGRTWRQFVAALGALGYAVEWQKLKACDFGAGTSRTRLFMVARCDGEPIRWPEPTHGPGRAQPYVTAADCIDWSIPCPSIFDRRKPLADATMRRIARGVRRYVLDTAEPFIVQCANASASGVHPGDEPLPTITGWPKGGAHAVVAPTLVPRYGERDGQAPRAASVAEPLATVVPTGNGASLVAPVLVPATHHGSDRVNDPADPLPTITAAHRGELMLAGAALVKFRGDSAGSAIDEPAPTITSGAGAARPAGAANALGVMTAFLEQAAGGPNSNTSRPRGADEPVSTIAQTGSQQRLVAVHLQHASTSNTNGGRGRADLPLRTVLAGGQHHAVVECTLSPEHEAGALRVAAFLMRYHGTGGQDADARAPLTTISTRDRLALVTVTIRGTPYVIVDIGLRMLQKHELFRAQGFPRGYIIDRTADGRPLTVSRSVAMCGNSVSPPPYEALLVANLDPSRQPLQEAA
ncbi:DNA cytosine methyltransferase [Luteimonas composti]|uniref:DNA (cytosine-5-)-methyltransferase n=1 Tax=Luteimonas composti TaxID=398257 RepID=A0ABT6MSY8_9GAMM|nr:DNA cytosine methyltransferase [Luteimonas composti]MDH7453545.1 DNA cytosine methyltransferase [Luteimonas composti]